MLMYMKTFALGCTVGVYVTWDKLCISNGFWVFKGKMHLLCYNSSTKNTKQIYQEEWAKIRKRILNLRGCEDIKEAGGGYKGKRRYKLLDNNLIQTRKFRFVIILFFLNIIYTLTVFVIKEYLCNQPGT